MAILISLLTSFFVIDRVHADGQAGVGVINVPPNYADIRIVERNGLIRVYLTISDYNSWGDIYMVEVNLGDNERSVASFVFKQYETADSFEKIHLFTEIPEGKDLLNIDSCDVSYSDSRKTVEDRCHIDLRFVFSPTFFSQIHIKTTDRAGSFAETIIEYRGGDMMRDQNTLLIPWIDGTVKLELPPFLLDTLLILISGIGAVWLGKRLKITSMVNQVLYGK
jgi:hypothetical protein